MSMYKLTPTFPSDFDVTPKIACYRVASYHDAPSQQPATTSSGGAVQGVKSEADPRKDLEKKQQVLIEHLKKQTEQLNQLLVGFGKANSAEKSTGKPAEKAGKAAGKAEKSAQKTEKAAPEPAQKEGGKKDKDAKKEARKAAKAEAVKKVATGEGTKTTQKSSAQGSSWTVTDDRKTWETNLTLTVNILPSLVIYPQEHLKNAVLTIREADFPWVRAFSKVGEKRGVAFEGEVKNQTKEKKTTVKVVKGSEVKLEFEKTTVKSLETIWKVLGAALGLFSRRSEQVLSASHQAIWFKKAEHILSGTGDISYSTREASQFLARFDSLSSQWEICAADIVFRSLLNLNDAHANNVESWAKKIDALIN